MAAVFRANLTTVLTQGLLLSAILAGFLWGPPVQAQSTPAVDAGWEELAAEGRWEDVRSRAEARLRTAGGDPEALFWLGREQLEEAWGLLAGDRVARDIGRSVLERAIDRLEQSHLAAVSDGADWLLQARFTLWELGEPGKGGQREPAFLSELERQWTEDYRAMAAFLRGHGARSRPGDDALPWFQRAAQADPGRSAFALDWCRELAAAGDRDQAVSAWRLARQAGDWQLGDLLAALLMALPSKDDAGRRLDLLDDLRQEPTVAHDALLAWHRAHCFGLLDRREDVAAAFALGTSGRTAQIDRAEATFLTTIGRYPDALSLLFPRARERDWQCLDDAVAIADGYAIARKVPEALAAYEQALSIEPRHEMALWHRALTLWQGGQRSAAAEAWEDVIARFPGRSDIVNDGALAAWGLGDRALAQQRLEQAIEWPGSEDAHENLAVLLLEQPNAGAAEAAKALDLLENVLRDDPLRDRSLLYRYRAQCLAASRGR
ncbi:MAG: tetratricopeptide (TPR) repeat protein [Pseudohongiellaceae bacterium]|jgi:tetratricopeptide (TPR) repeat protein